MRCGPCPARVDAPNPCLGSTHPPACGYVAAGRVEWVEHLRRLAEGLPLPADPGRIDVRIAMLAETCPMGHGCVCSSRPCSHPDRPGVVTGAECRACAAATDWGAGVESGW